MTPNARLLKSHETQSRNATKTIPHQTQVTLTDEGANSDGNVFGVMCLSCFFFLRGFPMDFATDFRWFSLFFHLGGDQNQHPICEDILYDWFYDVGLEDEQYHEKKHNIYIHSPTIIYVILKIFEAY